MNLKQNAVELVQKHLNHIYTHGSLFEQGLSTLLLARCLLATSTGQMVSNDSRTVFENAEILPRLSRAKKLFHQIEAYHHVKDVLFLEALLYHHLGYEKDRNTRALLFKQLDEQYPLKTSNHILIFVGL